MYPRELVYHFVQDFNISMRRVVIWVEYTRAYMIYGRSNNLKFTKNSGFSVKAQLHYLINQLHISAIF